MDPQGGAHLMLGYQKSVVTPLRIHVAFRNTTMALQPPGFVDGVGGHLMLGYQKSASAHTVHEAASAKKPQEEKNPWSTKS